MFMVLFQEARVKLHALCHVCFVTCNDGYSFCFILDRLSADWHMCHRSLLHSLPDFVSTCFSRWPVFLVKVKEQLAVDNILREKNMFYVFQYESLEDELDSVLDISNCHIVKDRRGKLSSTISWYHRMDRYLYERKCFIS